MVSVSFLDGATCSFEFGQPPEENAVRDRFFEHLGVGEDAVDIALAQGGRALAPLDLVDPRLHVCAVMRDVSFAADNGCPVAHSCALAPCCQEHRRWILFRQRQRALRSYMAERCLRQRCVRLWDRVECDFEALPSKRRPPRRTFQRVLSAARGASLCPGELDALERLSFHALWRGMLHLRDPRAAFLFQAWVRSR